MPNINRRDFVKLAGGATLAGLSLGFPYVAFGATRRVGAAWAAAPLPGICARWTRASR